MVKILITMSMFEKKEEKRQIPYFLLFLVLTLITAPFVFLLALQISSRVFLSFSFAFASCTIT